MRNIRTTRFNDSFASTQNVELICFNKATILFSVYGPISRVQSAKGQVHATTT